MQLLRKLRLTKMCLKTSLYRCLRRRTELLAKCMVWSYLLHLGEAAITGDGLESEFHPLPVARFDNEDAPIFPTELKIAVSSATGSNVSAQRPAHTSPGFNFLWLVTSRMSDPAEYQGSNGRGNSEARAPPREGIRLDSNMPRKMLRYMRLQYGPGLLARKQTSTSQSNATRSRTFHTRLLQNILSGGHIGFEMEFLVKNDSGSGYLISGRSVDDFYQESSSRSSGNNRKNWVLDGDESRVESNESSAADRDVTPSWFGLHVQVQDNGYVLRIEYKSAAWNSGQKYVVDLEENPFTFNDRIKLAVRIDFESNSVDYWLNCSHVQAQPAQRNRSMSTSYFSLFRLLQHKSQANRPVQVTFRSVVITDGKTPSLPKQCFSVPGSHSECTRGRVFMECGPSCRPTCENKQSTTRACSSACARGCHCPVGMLLDRGNCVEPRDCPCRIGAMNYSAASQVTVNNELCTCVAGAWKCYAVAHFIRTPLNRTVMAGQNTSLTCSVVGNPVPQLTWIVPPGTRYRIENVNGNRLSRLWLDNVSANSSGIYTCAARRLTDGWAANASARVDVIAPPVITSLPKTVSVTFGTRSFSIDCTVSGHPPPRAAWVKLNRKFPASARRYAAAPGVYRLKFVNVKPSDAGEYRCYAFNQAGKDKKSVFLLVTVPPPSSESFLRAPFNRYVKRGRRAVFPCQIIDHNERTNVTWYKDDQPLLIDGKRVVQKRQKLLIRRVNSKDAGKYTCLVTLPSEETMLASARLMVKGRMLPWSPWSQCSFSCGKGRMSRHRTCTGIPPNRKTCRGKFMVSKRCNLQVCPGICSSYGDPNYSTFDGYRFNFQGDCGYTLSKDVETKEFEIVQYNIGCGSHLSCVDKVTAVLAYPALSAFVELWKDGSVLVNGMHVNLPHVSSNQVMSIANIGLFVVLRVTDDLEIRWAIPHRLYVIAAGKYTGKTMGLCGNFNGNDADDMLAPGGRTVRTNLEFGQSWAQPDGSTNLSCSAVQSLSNPCARDPQRERRARDACFFLRDTRFADCHAVVDPALFIKTCKSDLCSSPVQETDLYFCTALSAYSEECLRHGVKLDWRSEEICPIQCPAQKTYSERGPTCVRYCPAIVKNGSICVANNRGLPGCYCDSEHVMHNGSCIPLSQCPCSFNGMLFEAGQLHDRNCQRCNCSQGKWACVFNSLLCNYPASVVKGPTSQIVPFGDSVTFCCEVVGIPTPDVHWYRNGEKVRVNGSGSKQTGGDSNNEDLNSTLHLQNVSVSDSGTYSCKAVNRLGTHNSHLAHLTIIDPTVTSCSPNPARNVVQLPEGCFVSSATANRNRGGTTIDLGSCSGDPCYAQSYQIRPRQCMMNRHCCQPSVTRPILVRCRHALYNTSFHITVVDQCACVTCTNRVTVVEGVVRAAGKGIPVKHVKVTHRGRILGYTSSSGSFQLSLASLPPEAEHVTLTFTDVMYKHFTTTIKNLLVLPGQSTIHTVTMYPCSVRKRFHASRGLQYVSRPTRGNPRRMRLVIPPGSLISDQQVQPYNDVVTAVIALIDDRHLSRHGSGGGAFAGSSIAVNLTGEEQLFSLSVALCVSLYSRTGRLLNLIPGRSASFMLSSPSVGPKLQPWVLDDSTGYWREHSERLEVVPHYPKKGSKVLMLTAKIKRFNMIWALGSSRTPCYLRAQVLDSNSNPVPAVRLVFTASYGNNRPALTMSRRRSSAASRGNPVTNFYVEGLTRERRQSNGICLPVGCHDVGLLYASKLGNELVLLTPEEPPTNMGMVKNYPVTRSDGRRRQTLTSKVLDTSSPFNATGLPSHFAYFANKEDCATTRPNLQTYIFRDYSDASKKNVLSRIRSSFNNRVIQTFAMAGSNRKPRESSTKFCHVQVLVRFRSSFAHQEPRRNILESLTFWNKSNGGMTVLGWRRVEMQQPSARHLRSGSDHSEVVCIEYVCNSDNTLDTDDLVVYLSLRYSTGSGDNSDTNLSERPNCNFTTYRPPPIRLARRASRLSAHSFEEVTFNRGGYVYVSGRPDVMSRQEQSQFKLTNHEAFRHVFEGKTRDISKRKCGSSSKHVLISAFFECW